jgi:hypothetical protein
MAATHDAAGTDREACAEVARKPKGKKHPRVRREKKPKKKNKVDEVEKIEEVKPGEVPLPEDPAAFVDEVHLRADFIEIAKALLNSQDEKVKQRAWERMLEMKYGSGAAPVEEAQHIVIDVPRPARD